MPIEQHGRRIEIDGFIVHGGTRCTDDYPYALGAFAGGDRHGIGIPVHLCSESLKDVTQRHHSAIVDESRRLTERQHFSVQLDLNRVRACQPGDEHQPDKQAR